MNKCNLIVRILDYVHIQFGIGLGTNLKYVKGIEIQYHITSLVKHVMGTL